MKKKPGNVEQMKQRKSNKKLIVVKSFKTSKLKN